MEGQQVVQVAQVSLRQTVVPPSFPLVIGVLHPRKEFIKKSENEAFAIALKLLNNNLIEF